MKFWELALAALGRFLKQKIGSLSFKWKLCLSAVMALILLLVSQSKDEPAKISTAQTPPPKNESYVGIKPAFMEAESPPRYPAQTIASNTDSKRDALRTALLKRRAAATNPVESRLSTSTYIKRVNTRTVSAIDNQLRAVDTGTFEHRFGKVVFRSESYVFFIPESSAVRADDQWFSVGYKKGTSIPGALTGTLIVKVDGIDITSLAKRFDLRVQSIAVEQNLGFLVGDNRRSSFDLIAEMERVSGVVYVEPEILFQRKRPQ